MYVAKNGKEFSDETVENALRDYVRDFDVKKPEDFKDGAFSMTLDKYDVEIKTQACGVDRDVNELKVIRDKLNEYIGYLETK